MFGRAGLLIVLLAQLNGCVAVPTFEVADRLTFDVLQPNQRPMSYDDLLCCYRCDA